MDKHSVAQAIKTYADKKPNLTVDEGTITWQVSHVWLAGGLKAYYSSIEDFYLNTIFNCSHYESGYVGQAPWLERVNLPNWCQGLRIEPANIEQVQRELEDGLNEALENEPEEEFDAENFKVDGVIERAWSISESTEPRTALGGHWAFLFETRDTFFYLERNWES